MNSCLVVFLLSTFDNNLLQSVPIFLIFYKFDLIFYQLDQLIVCWLQRVCFTAFLLLLKIWALCIRSFTCEMDDFVVICPLQSNLFFFNWMMLKRDWYLFHKLIPFCYDKMCINFSSALIWMCFVVFFYCVWGEISNLWIMSSGHINFVFNKFWKFSALLKKFGCCWQGVQCLEHWMSQNLIRQNTAIPYLHFPFQIYSCVNGLCIFKSCCVHT